MRNSKTAFLALLAIFATLAILWQSRGPAPSESATWDDAVAQAQNGGYRLITTDDVWKQYDDSPGRLLLVDTRQAWEYRAGHIRGAVNFPMEPTWLARWQKRKSLAEFLGSNKDRTIVFY